MQSIRAVGHRRSTSRCRPCAAFRRGGRGHLERAPCADELPEQPARAARSRRARRPPPRRSGRRSGQREDQTTRCRPSSAWKPSTAQYWPATSRRRRRAAAPARPPSRPTASPLAVEMSAGRARPQVGEREERPRRSPRSVTEPRALAGRQRLEVRADLLVARAPRLAAARRSRPAAARRGAAVPSRAARRRSPRRHRRRFACGYARPLTGATSRAARSARGRARVGGLGDRADDDDALGAGRDDRVHVAGVDAADREPRHGRVRGGVARRARAPTAGRPGLVGVAWTGPDADVVGAAAARVDLLRACASRARRARSGPRARGRRGDRHVVLADVARRRRPRRRRGRAGR